MSSHHVDPNVANNHEYPTEELDAMLAFYGGKRCIVLNSQGMVQWSHILDASLEASNRRLLEMLNRNLRQDRHPRHAAEVRENIVPLGVYHHGSMDGSPPQSTIFLHEDILARTLAYEQDLQRWRIAELEAGRGDPGRPAYEEVFGAGTITQHRYHAKDITPFFRETVNGGFIPYSSIDCPGIDNPSSQHNFPVIDTLLSIPFSLLHTLPRLSAMISISTYQKQLIVISTEISQLWWWDPDPGTIKRSEEIRRHNFSTTGQDDIRKPKPDPIHHLSRSNNTTFSTMQPTFRASTLHPSSCNLDHNTQTIGTFTMNSSSYSYNLNRDARTVELPSGQILLGTVSSLSWCRDGLSLTPGMETEDVQHQDKFTVARVASYPTASEISHQAASSTGNFEDTDSIENFGENPGNCASSIDTIISWDERVVNCGVEPLPLTPSPFEKGVMGGLSVNDTLMIKGLINPLVYVQFLDLSLFSC